MAFTTAGLNRLEAIHHPDNQNSGRVLTKAGFIHVGVRNQRAWDGTTAPYELYARQRNST
ncbi:GNAT family N-acetyltransferase [Streptomyces sp. NPDC060184]|uniref:GNAT family N-acetyltransferase n=1 Tax=Streptomyces sp. NPDC060184 TaxID=3347064 RepID=UPI00365B4A89